MPGWVTYGILFVLMLVVFALYLIARRAFSDFKRGMEEGKG